MDQMGNREKIIDKIQKILNKADKNRNSSLEEVESAMDIAYKLLQRYGLSMADVATVEEAASGASSEDIGEVVGATFKCSKIPKWMSLLISAVNGLTDTKGIIRSFIPGKSGYGTIQIVFIGFPEDVAVANDLFSYLRNTVTKLSTKHQTSAKATFTQWRSFAEGCSCKLLQRSLKLKKENWVPGQDEKNSTPFDLDNFMVDDMDEEDNDESEDEENDSEEIDEPEFSEETHKKYELMIANKKTVLEEHLETLKLETERLSTSSKLDSISFEVGNETGDSISLHTNNLIKKK